MKVDRQSATLKLKVKDAWHRNNTRPTYVIALTSALRKERRGSFMVSVVCVWGSAVVCHEGAI